MTSRVRILLGATLACVAVGAAVPAIAPAAKRPNFVVESAKIKKFQIPEGVRFIAITKVKNTGEGKGPKTATELSLGLKPEDGGVSIHSESLKALKSGARFVVRSKVTAPEPTDDPMVIVACADSEDQVQESDEEDNCTETRAEIGIVPDGFAVTASGDMRYGTITERWSVMIPLIPDVLGDYSTTFGATGGTVNWQIEGTVSDGCSGSATRTIEGSDTWAYYTPFPEPDDIGPQVLALRGPDEPSPFFTPNTYELDIRPGGWNDIPEVELGPCGNTESEARAFHALNGAVYQSEPQPWEGETSFSGQRLNYESPFCDEDETCGVTQSFGWSLVRSGTR